MADDHTRGFSDTGGAVYDLGMARDSLRRDPRPEPPAHAYDQDGAKLPPRLIPVPWSELHRLPKREPLIKGLLGRGAMSVLYGASNTGKTFIGLDIAVHVALGRPWRELKVKQGAVIYVAAEGGIGINERLTAWRLYHDIEIKGVPLHVIPEAIDLCHNDGDAKLLMGRIKEIGAVELIVIDTVSRAMAGGNENGPDDMGRLVKHCDAVRMETGAHLMAIHHTGKDDSRGARGHSLLKAATDTEVEVTASSGYSVAKVVKQRDYQVGDEFPFRLESMVVDTDEDGDPITSCVVIETEAAAKTVAEPNLTKNQRTMYGILYDAGPSGLSWSDWQARCKEAGVGLKRKADLFDIRRALVAKGLVYEGINGWSVRYTE